MKKYMVEEGASFEQDKIYTGGVVYNHRYHYVLSQKNKYFSAERGSIAGNFHGYGQGDGKRKGMLHCQDYRF